MGTFFSQHVHTKMLVRLMVAVFAVVMFTSVALLASPARIFADDAPATQATTAPWKDGAELAYIGNGDAESRQTIQGKDADKPSFDAFSMNAHYANDLSSASAAGGSPQASYTFLDASATKAGKEDGKSPLVKIVMGNKDVPDAGSYEKAYTDLKREDDLRAQLKRALYYGFVGQKGELGITEDKDWYTATQIAVWQICHHGETWMAGADKLQDIALPSYGSKAAQAAALTLLKNYVFAQDEAKNDRYTEADIPLNLYVALAPETSGVDKMQNMVFGELKQQEKSAAAQAPTRAAATPNTRDASNTNSTSGTNDAANGSATRNTAGSEAGDTAGATGGSAGAAGDAAGAAGDTTGTTGDTAGTTGETAPAAAELKTKVRVGGVEAAAGEIVHLDGNASVAVIDTVEYTGLTPGATYMVTGTLMKFPEGEEVITVEEECVADASGSGTWIINFDMQDLKENAYYVVHESAVNKADASDTAEHKDNTDTAQAVVVESVDASWDIMASKPSFARAYEHSMTTAVSINGKAASTKEARTLTGADAAKVSKVSDVITYKGFSPSESYTIEGELVDVSAKKTVATASLTPEVDASGAGTWTMEFTDVKLEAGKKYVVYEVAIDGEGNEVAVHADDSNKAQTIVVTTTPSKPSVTGKKTTAKTADSTGNIALVVLLVAFMAAGSALAARRKVMR